MSNTASSGPDSYGDRFSIGSSCFLICVVHLISAGGALAQNARTPPSYVVDGLTLGARVNFESQANRGYLCSTSELFSDFMRCQRTQRQQDGITRRSFEITNSILHDRDGKAVYINRHIAPWTFDWNETQAELKQISSRLGQRPREMRLPQREGLQSATIAVWGNIELTQLDSDAIAILAAGESPRKGLLIDYLGNLRRSAQAGLPVYSINGGAGYLWAASVDRNNRGHIRVLAVDPAALFVATAPSGTASLPPPGSELLPDEIPPKNETAVPEPPSANTKPVPVEAEKTSIETAVSETGPEQAAVPEPDKIAPLLVRLEAAETKGRVMERLVYWTLGGLISVLIIAASLLLRMRKKANVVKAQISASETQPESPAEDGQTSQAECPRLPREILAEQGTAASGPVSQAETAANSTRKQKQEEINESGSQKQGAQVVAVNGKKYIGAQPPEVDVIACAHCNGEIFTTDKFCMHCGASVSRENERTRPCSSCRQEIGTSDKFCRYCGASSLAVASPSMTFDTGASPDLGSARADGKVNEVVASTRAPVKKKRGRR